MDTITIFDTTLRDGEQSPGATMSIRDKIEIATMLDELGVDVIEAGFPAASQDDFRGVQEIVEAIQRPTIAALARCTERDIVQAGEALHNAENGRGRIHTFIATSPIHRETKLKMSRDQIIEAAVEGVRLAKNFTSNVQFSAEDAGRTELDYLAEIVEAAIEAGATTINLPDTVGYCTPEQYGEIFRYIRQAVPKIWSRNIVLSCHCHNDLGLAVANTLAAIREGASQAELTVNGIGERAGNAALEEVIMALRIHEDRYKVRNSINTTLLVPTSRRVARSTWSVQRNKAIAGTNAFAHEAGIHQDGMLKNRETYEIMTPESVGWDGTQLILGKHSGKAAVIDKLTTLKMPVRQEDHETIMERFKRVADGKAVNVKYVSDEELLDAIYFPCIIEIMGGNQIVRFEEGPLNDHRKTVTIELRDGRKIEGIAADREQGPVSAMKNAMTQVMHGVDVGEQGLHLDAVGGGGAEADAIAWMTLKNGHSVTRSGMASDTNRAELQAMINAFNALSALDTYEAMIKAKQ